MDGLTVPLLTLLPLPMIGLFAWIGVSAYRRGLVNAGLACFVIVAAMLFIEALALREWAGR